MIAIIVMSQEPENVYKEGQSTRHETDIISHFALVAVGYANTANEL